jgi:AcrR family transcriptional regulator
MDTRDRLLHAATRLFADKGFYGASIADIADEVGITKQALIHHFGTKEKLYGLVLQRIADDFAMTMERASTGHVNPAEELEQLFTVVAAEMGRRLAPARLLMRELLDNRPRAARAEKWYLKSLLDTLIAKLRAVPRWAQADDAEALVALYQLLGAIHYFAISEPTLERLFGKRGYDEATAAFAARLSVLVRAMLTNGPMSARRKP